MPADISKVNLETFHINTNQLLCKWMVHCYCL